MTYISHARTPEQLKAEICSDLNRRLAFLDGQVNTIARSASDKAKLNCAKIEIESLLRYWSEVEIIRPKQSRKRDEVNGT
jgi:hypothetical protein